MGRMPLNKKDSSGSLKCYQRAWNWTGSMKASKLFSLFNLGSCSISSANWTLCYLTWIVTAEEKGADFCSPKKNLEMVKRGKRQDICWLVYFDIRSVTRISCAQIYLFRHIHPQAIYIIIGKTDQKEIRTGKKKKLPILT